jgi:ankyrin repeat protein
VVGLLLAHPRVDVEARDLSGNTALALARLHGRDAVVALLEADPRVRR